MNPRIGWLLAALFSVLAIAQFGWQGAVFATTLVVFWLLLQFSRTVRALKVAAGRPVGRIVSAPELLPRLRPGLPLADLLLRTRSLGAKADWPAAAGEPAETEDPQSPGAGVYLWTDASGHRLRVALHKGRVSRWRLEPAGEAVEVAAPPAA